MMGTSVHAIGLLLLAAGAQDPEGAQQSQEASEGAAGETLTSIVVSAQRRDQSLQDVPISAAAFDAAALERLNVTDFPNLGAIVPNLTLTGPFGASSPQASIRGIGVSVFTQTTEGAVAVYVDEVYRSNPATQSLNAYDLERVEVLRGPQGTLYGRNATGGVISVVSRIPRMRDEGMAWLEYGRFNTVNAIAAAETTLAPDVGVRLAANYRYSEGDRVNLFRNERMNEQNSFSGRMSLRWSPEGSTFDGTLIAYGNRVRNGLMNLKSTGILPNPAPSGPGQGPIVNPTTPDRANPLTGYLDTASPFTTRADFAQFEDLDLLGATLNLSYDFGPATLTSISAVVDAERLSQVDADASPFPLAHATFGSDVTTYSQEFRLASPSQARLSWLAGVSYLHEDLDIANINLLAFVNRATIDAVQQTDSVAGFADLAYRITDQFTLRAGGRYTWDRKRFRTDQTNPLVPNSLSPLEPPPLIIAYADRASWDAFSWRIVGEYQTSADLLLYASAARGFRSGGFNVNLYFDRASEVPVGPETATSYEIGIKSQWLGNRLRVNATLFHTDIDDLQVLVPAGIGQALVNAGSARSRGAEIEIEAAPVRGLRANLALGFLDAEYTDFVLFPGGPSYRGQALNYSPRFKLNADVTYTRPINSGLDGFIAIDANHRSAFFNNPENDLRSGDDGYALVNSRVGIRGGSWEASAWVRNLFGEGFSYGGLNLNGFGFYQTREGERRTYGLTLSYRFE